MKKGWIQAIDGEVQENIAPKTTADLVYEDNTQNTTIQQALLEKNSVEIYTHTYDSNTKTHNLEGEGTVGWVRVTAPYTGGDVFTLNGEPLTAYAPRHDPRLFCFEPGRTVIFTIADDTVDFLTCGARLKVQNVELYGVRIDKADSNPDTRCTYLYDAEGKSPAKMIFSGSGNSFDYGDWANVGFVRDNRPVMLRSNGEVTYALDPSNVALKAGGGASDVSNTAFDGNAMSEMPRWWLKQYEDADYQYILVSNVNYDEEFHAYAFTREDGSLAEQVYLPMYRGCNINGKLRSMSGLTLTSQSVANGIAYATANGACWSTKSWAQVDYVNALLTLISCSTNSQKAFGAGYCNSTTPLTTGSLNTAGQFFGYNDENHRAKVFWCEDWWGNFEDQIEGLVAKNHRIHVKMSPPYNLQGEDYIDTGVTPVGTYGYITAMHFSHCGKIPCVSGAEGSVNTYWADHFEAGLPDTYAMVGGGSTAHGFAGPFRLHLEPTAYSSNRWGTSLSALP